MPPVRKAEVSHVSALSTAYLPKTRARVASDRHRLGAAETALQRRRAVVGPFSVGPAPHLRLLRRRWKCGPGRERGGAGGRQPPAPGAPDATHRLAQQRRGEARCCLDAGSVAYKGWLQLEGWLQLWNRVGRAANRGAQGAEAVRGRAARVWGSLAEESLCLVY
jgi:hypothetical protein